MKCRFRQHRFHSFHLMDLFSALVNLVSQLTGHRTLISASKLILPLSLTTLLFSCWTGNLQKPQQSNDKMIDLTKLSLEELMNMEFVTVSKKPERLFESAAAAFAITQSDIRRSGATNIPDALRMVPGMQVAQHDANSWAITARGFSGLSRGISGQFANKLLVLHDGRSVYTPLFSGVSWETQDVLLEDVERIEVIRGPGATLWGANAVNGIINIIAKKAQDTQGGLVSVGAGSELRSFGHFRYGGNIGESSYFRIYTKYLNVDNLVDSAGNETADAWHVLRGGFRTDWNISTNNLVVLQGDIYRGEVGQRYNVISSPEPPFPRRFDFDAHISGGNVLGRWQHSFSKFSDLTLQLYFDRVKREEAVVKGLINTFDLDFQHRFLLTERQEIIWGTGYRFISDKFDSTFTFSLLPGSRSVHLFNAFLQDEIALIKHRLSLTLGSKFEHNDYTGFEIQPNLRLLWMPMTRHTVWGAISRAVRTPSRGEDDARIVLQALSPSTPTTFLVLLGNRDFDSENLLALELGYRVRPSYKLSLDLTTFYNNYKHLRTDEPDISSREPSPFPPNGIIPLMVDNKLDGTAYGLEVAADWRASKQWQFRAAYSYLKLQLDPHKNSLDTFTENIEGQSPHHQLFVRSLADLIRNVELDLRFRYVDNLPRQGVDSYFTFDFRVGWQMNKNLELSVVGQNLVDNHHPENSQILKVGNPQVVTGTESSEVQRSVYGKITWQF
ncbi:MAG: TonB-dependent receptor plug domain-containing protein [bacterium]